ncbi:cell division protein ZapA [Echinimonas agarilytica]|uniref:Cell division protein ZapA n=1 Tax=Echinimonas agarilytica TaxID=1215918 RepID=A0AA41W4Z8_9GAMM|nr:cell division protein ZapA [Echinimonas agarilytica]MCM2678888.1 cell division protein ZapA [Echinimonas agarilytica]
MRMTNEEFEIKLLGRKFTMRCAEEETHDLREAAAILEQKLEQLCGERSQHNIEQIALLAALNLSHDLLLEQRRSEAYIKSMDSRIKTLQATVERALNKPRTMVDNG